MAPAGTQVTGLVGKEQQRGLAAGVVATGRGEYPEETALAKEPAMRHGRQLETQLETQLVKLLAKEIASGVEGFRRRDFAPAQESRKQACLPSEHAIAPCPGRAF